MKRFCTTVRAGRLRGGSAGRSAAAGGRVLEGDLAPDPAGERELSSGSAAALLMRPKGPPTAELPKVVPWSLRQFQNAWGPTYLAYIWKADTL